MARPQQFRQEIENIFSLEKGETRGKGLAIH